jgi:hypothetical protein
MSCAILFSSCILVTLKFIAGQTCRPSLAEKGLKDWANKLKLKLEKTST